MDLIPTPGQIVAASANAAQKVLYGGLADLRPMPRTLLTRGPLREVYHYRPAGSVTETGDPVLLVAPLAAPALAYDLRRGCSLVEHLVEQGRPTYLLDYGEVSFADPDLALDPWVLDVLPAAVHEVSRHAGGRPVHLVGWGAGGVFALLAAAGARAVPGDELPVASVTALAVPVDLDPVPLVAPRLPAAVPGPLLRGALHLVALTARVTRPLAQLGQLRRLDDREFLAHAEAVDRIAAATRTYRGRGFGRLFHRLLADHDLAGGSVRLRERTLDLADIDVPVLAVAGAEDPVVPADAARPLVDLLTGAPEARLEVVPGDHLGLLTGREARSSTWSMLDAFLDRHSAARVGSAIGANPQRRFSSAGSRSLSPARSRARGAS